MISVSVTYTAFAGYIIASHQIDFGVIPVLLGVYLLSSGASAFNQIAERKTDALMPRTKNRPVPSGRVSLKSAIVFALVMSIIGCFILAFNAGIVVTLLGIFNLLWYNLVYTPLKKRTVWAVFVGTITGVIPFYMGYLSIASEFPSTIANFIAIFLLIWQIPHFLLLLGIYGKEYEMAGLASMTKKTEESNLFKLSAIWMIACCIISMLLPLFQICNYRLTGNIIVLIALTVFVITLFSQVFVQNKKFRFLFIISNLMQLAIITCLVVDALV
jgi:heme o synthase